MRTPDQAQLQRWVEKQYDIDEIERAELITRNAVRLRLRSGEDYVLICRQSGRIDRLRTEELLPAAV